MQTSPFRHTNKTVIPFWMIAAGMAVDILHLGCRSLRMSAACKGITERHLFIIGVELLCHHSNLEYVGIYSAQDEDDLASFRTEAAVQGAREFARKLLSLER